MMGDFSEKIFTSYEKAADGEEPAPEDFMNIAINEARKGICNKEGGPFGCVVVKNGKVVGIGHNRVLIDNDSTMHGEIAAIRDAEKKLGTYDLSGCDIYTTAEPCPMCFAACMWANISHIFYGCTIEDTSRIGFRDKRFDELMGGRDKLADYLTQMQRKACLELFNEYDAMEKTIY